MGWTLRYRRPMTRIAATIEQEFPNYTPQQQSDVLVKLRRYVERGLWAQDVLARLGHNATPQENADERAELG